MAALKRFGLRDDSKSYVEIFMRLQSGVGAMKSEDESKMT